MEVSIVIVNYNAAQLVINAIDSVKEHTKGVSFEVIVVDNDSKDGSESLVLAQHPTVKWIQTGYNAGFARANNAGFAVAQGEYILLLNADTLFFDDVLTKAVNRLKADSTIAAVGGLQLNADKSPMPYYKNSTLLRRTFYILPFPSLLERLFPEPVFPNQNQTDLLVGAFMLLPKSVVKQTGGFSEDFFMYGEDVEWCGRLAKVGKLCYFEDICFIHLENESPFRRKNTSFVNRFSVQMQVSNLLWIRKQFGVLAYLVIMLHYVSLGLFFYVWKVAVTLLKGKKPFSELTNQLMFLRKVGVLLKFFLPTLFNRKGFYKVSPLDNIDQRFS